MSLASDYATAEADLDALLGDIEAAQAAITNPKLEDNSSIKAQTLAQAAMNVASARHALGGSSNSDGPEERILIRLTNLSL